MRPPRPRRSTAPVQTQPSPSDTPRVVSSPDSDSAAPLEDVQVPAIVDEREVTQVDILPLIGSRSASVTPSRPGGEGATSDPGHAVAGAIPRKRISLARGRSTTQLVDDVLTQALRSATGGLDLDIARTAVSDGLTALQRQLSVLATAPYDEKDYANVARAAMQTMRALDDVFRLAQFARGLPDSRTEVVGDLFAVLTGEQLATLQGWLDAKEGRR